MTPRPFAQIDVFTDTPGYGNPVAVVLDGRDLDAAYEWVERAIEERDTLAGFVHIYTPLLAPELASDSRYESLLKRLHVADVAR